MANSLSLSKPIFIKDKSVVGVLLPNTKNFSKALKNFVAELAMEKESDEFDEWDNELDSPEAHKRYKNIIADCDANDGWIDGEKFFNELRESRKSRI